MEGEGSLSCANCNTLFIPDSTKYLAIACVAVRGYKTHHAMEMFRPSRQLSDVATG